MKNSHYANNNNQNNLRTSLSDMAYAVLKERLPDLPSGSYLSVRQFAQEVDMSYTPVREAFLRVEQEGMLRLVPNVGFFVERIGLKELMQIFQVRECLEVFVLDKVFDYIKKEHIEKMKTINAKQYKALSNGDIKEYHRLDFEFHKVIFDIYGNKHLLDFYRIIREKYTIVSERVGRLLSDEAFIEHSEYFKYLENGNKEKALEELKVHINKATERMKEGYFDVLG